MFVFSGFRLWRVAESSIRVVEIAVGAALGDGGRSGTGGGTSRQLNAHSEGGSLDPSAFGVINPSEATERHICGRAVRFEFTTSSMPWLT